MICSYVLYLKFLAFYSAQGPGLRRGPSLKMQLSQIGTLETLIGSRGLYSDHVLWDVRSTSLAKYETVMVLACQVVMVLAFHLTLTQINSKMNCIAKNKCPESQKLETRRRCENLNATSHASRAATCSFFVSLSLIYSM